VAPDAGLVDAALAPDRRGVSLGRFYPVEFGRLIAKIAHGYAMAHYGFPTRFRLLLPGVILGTAGNLFDLVGTVGKEPPPSSSTNDVDLDFVAVNDRDYQVARVRLLAWVGSPTYLAVASEGPSREASGIPCIVDRLDQRRANGGTCSCDGGSSPRPSMPTS